MPLETVPLIVLYEFSIVLARIFGQPAEAALDDVPATSSWRR
jgi:Sec-independent protein secretion pathway component TatC